MNKVTRTKTEVSPGALGISRETLQEFEVEDYTAGWRYPTYHLRGDRGLPRIRYRNHCAVPNARWNEASRFTYRG